MSIFFEVSPVVSACLSPTPPLVPSNETLLLHCPVPTQCLLRSASTARGGAVSSIMLGPFVTSSALFELTHWRGFTMTLGGDMGLKGPFGQPTVLTSANFLYFYNS